MTQTTPHDHPHLFDAIATCDTEIALSLSTQEFTYTTLTQRLEGIAAHCVSLGLQRGQIVALVAQPSAAQVLSLLGLWRAGVLAMPLNPAFPAEQLCVRMAQVGCHTLCHDGSVAVETLRPEWQTLLCQTLLACSSDKIEPAEVPAPPSLDDHATLILTSGSSGTPKAALHSHRNHIASARGSQQNIPLSAGDRWLLSLPLFHVAGIAILYRCLLHGATIVLPRLTQSLGEVLATQAITHASMVPTQLTRLLEEQPPRPRSHFPSKAVLLGGSAIPRSLLTRATERGLPTYTSYGSTEMSSQICTTTPAQRWRDDKQAGQLLPYRTLQLTTQQEIWVRGETLFEGYLTTQGLDTARNAEGWFETGDTGTLAEDGQLTITGRRDHMFISGGENIQPAEIEGYLYQHPAVKQVMVVARPDEEFGHRPVALLQLHSSHTLEALVPALRAHLQAHLPKFKVPDQWLPWPPHLITGIKASRRILQDYVHSVI